MLSPLGEKKLAEIRSTGYYVDDRKNPRKSSELQLKIHVHFDLWVLISISNQYILQ